METRTAVYFIIAWVTHGQHSVISTEKVISYCSVHDVFQGVLWSNRVVSAGDIADF